MIFLYFLIPYLVITMVIYLFSMWAVKNVADGDIGEYFKFISRMKFTDFDAYEFFDNSESKPEKLSTNDFIWLCLLIGAFCWPITLFLGIKSYFSK